MNYVRTIFCKGRQAVKRENTPFIINSNFNLVGRRYINMGMKKLNKGSSGEEVNYTTNQPKAVRVPIMRFFYGIIVLMAVVPICQTLYETNKYYEENKHLYEKEQS
ncbi:conserved Plasmodium protein, unknown function [Plasmodium knowlesi strain H]|uniref:Uncharacterized protein n=3 Tax=Plasmodium knowlesi TaxID=5850 RepID=A0A5K1U773_PLAKH|nr:conserved Plasmodium protein, unknown function [Plasmodium knowlesi strain H]OTN64456.1 Uncharacterized protein PKNOH_S130208300 [Plasmodium knowlesi]CAA9989244.1 conserved Plasmodium protein, unknown function [Plasmodium knowlesi strain H]SBO26192.1 conserved Plasmodium protein, unknown function [Plasmodium knowlesi strain H]SBO27045.1 conserved Plasmodium protein, unknown function [Plasmodium knowlesi strain H]VVS78718.1 conserved Plasmodium protein, unknown function [Plasmodium knowlesi |eukprot:XP_002261590.1 hypothetical protein, conserved in Plasmodium species [Plasmodium knowlesi strain H]